MNEKYYMTRGQIEILLKLVKGKEANDILKEIKEKQNITNRWMELYGSPTYD